MKESSISKAMKDFMKINEIENLKTLLEYPDENIIKLHGFNWHIMKEIISLRQIQHFNQFPSN